jgi:selenocysteine-specific translation elongation factor
MKVGLRGDYVAIKLSGVDYKDIKRGMTLVSADRSPDED